MDGGGSWGWLGVVRVRRLMEKRLDDEFVKSRWGFDGFLGPTAGE